MCALFMCAEKKLHQIAASARGYSNNVGVFTAGKFILGTGEPRSRIVRVIAGAKYDYDACRAGPGYLAYFFAAAPSRLKLNFWVPSAISAIAPAVECVNTATPSR